MEIICSSAGIVDPLRPVQGLGDIVKAGFSHVLGDFSWFCTPGDLESIGTGKKHLRFSVKEQAAEMLEKSIAAFFTVCRQQGVEVSAARVPRLLRNTRRCDLNDLLQELALACIRGCRAAGCHQLVVPPLSVGIAAEELWPVNRAFYLSLAAEAESQGVRLLLENQCRSVHGHMVRGICSDGEMAVEWLEQLNQAVGWNCFGFCLNVGNANLCALDMRTLAGTIGDYLQAVVLRDCDGNTESSLLPFTAAPQGVSRTDWLNLIRGLRECGFSGALILDFADTARAFSPLLRPSLLQLAAAIGRYISWQVQMEDQLRQYPSRVLFGAGNMCRNYMKCYGEKYPPLFTCDNNERLWDTEFCGLMIKSPEQLRELPGDCAIFICNIYYREIEEQLRAMGLENPIAYFNDEYMPSFYFDRLYTEEREK